MLLLKHLLDYLETRDERAAQFAINKVRESGCTLPDFMVQL